MGTAPRVLNALSLSARPIAVPEFVDALSSIWRPPRCYGENRKETVGLAISGGVDSMALAALCSQIQTDIHGSRSRERCDLRLASLRTFEAFVVDHGVRNGSTAEAQAVKKILNARGIKTRVLNIDWAPVEKPAEAPNFESLARTYRYQVLGKACRDHGINSLLLAHHEDDQAETVMMRLISGHKRLGLVGMKPDSEIPECYGIHGVHESGGQPDSSLISKIQEMHSRGKSSVSKDARYRAGPYMEAGSQLALETGGIRVYRPLLNFDKGRLIATCKAQEIEWFEDKTNKDPALTPRNAIRHMYKSHTLPGALTKPALLKLSRRCQKTANAQLKTVETCLSQCIIKSLDTRTGTINIRFNDMNDSACPPQADRKLIAANTLRRIIMLVTNREHVPPSSLHGSLKYIFPEVFSPEELVSQQRTFTVAGVRFEPLTKHDEEIPLSNRCEWFISRQPHASSIPPPIITVPPSRNASWSEWTLYDGRYWIRIQNLSTGTILVHPFHMDDYDKFRHSFSQSTRRVLHALLKDLAPGSVRYTLPSIVRRGEDGQETVIALPTLSFRTPGSKGIVSWDIRYKKLHIFPLSIPNQPS